MNQEPKVAILGGGVAGMACALWLKHLGMVPVILEKAACLGGQLLQINRVNRWVLGTYGKTSRELAEIYAAHIHYENIDIHYQSTITNVSVSANGFDVEVTEANAMRSLSVGAIVIASGVRAVAEEIFTDIPGFQAVLSAGLVSFFPLDHLNKLQDLSGKTVFVIGGGDNAHFTAKDCALAGAKVYLMMRSKPKARHFIRKQVEDLTEQGLIIERKEAVINAFRFDEGHVELNLLCAESMAEKLCADTIFVRAGFVANSQFMDDITLFTGIEKREGYLSTDAAKRTSVPWVYAIGDIASRKYQSVATALADGAIAAQDLSERM